MYFPYFRGKQYELLTVRETAPVLAKSGFVPIIEPVKQALAGLERSLDAVCEADGKAIVIVNPYHGDHSLAGDGISALLNADYLEQAGIGAGVLLKESMTAGAVAEYCGKHDQHELTLVHAGFPSETRRRVDAACAPTRGRYRLCAESIFVRVYQEVRL
jgi:hypothetical protein